MADLQSAVKEDEAVAGRRRQLAGASLDALVAAHHDLADPYDQMAALAELCARRGPEADAGLLRVAAMLDPDGGLGGIVPGARVLAECAARGLSVPVRAAQ